MGQDTSAAVATPAATPVAPPHGYHHGDLRATLLTTALEMLEAGESFSLRAVARRAGVSTAAPYRHFADRDALESALAVHGLQELMHDLTDGPPLPGTPAAVGELAVRYVRFALRRPALFRLMFGRACTPGVDGATDPVHAAAQALEEHLVSVVSEVHPHSDPVPLAMAAWSLAHGLAFLHLDGKLTNTDPAEVDQRVRSTVASVFPSPPTTEQN